MQCDLVEKKKKTFYTISDPYIKLNRQLTMKVSEYFSVL